MLIAISREDAYQNMEMFEELAAALEERYAPNARQVTSDHWVFEIMTTDQRSQVVHFLYKSLEADGQDLSRVVADSPIGPLPRRFDLEQLLRRNAELDVGAICVEDFRNEDDELVTYLTLRASHRLATLGLEECREIVEKVARVADTLERDVYARDLH